MGCMGKVVGKWKKEGWTKCVIMADWQSMGREKVEGGLDECLKSACVYFYFLHSHHENTIMTCEWGDEPPWLLYYLATKKIAEQCEFWNSWDFYTPPSLHFYVLNNFKEMSNSDLEFSLLNGVPGLPLRRKNIIYVLFQDGQNKINWQRRKGVYMIIHMWMNIMKFSIYNLLKNGYICRMNLWNIYLAGSL